MQDTTKLLEELNVPDVHISKHQQLLKKQLYIIAAHQGNSYKKGGEWFMRFTSPSIIRGVIVGVIALFVVVYSAIQYSSGSLQKANAQELAKKALSKVSALPLSEQAKFQDEKETLQKAVSAKDLKVAVQIESGVTISVLKFTDTDGNEKSIEIDNNDLPVVSPTVTSVPSITPIISHAVNRHDDVNETEDSNSEQHEIKSQNTQIHQERVTSQDSHDAASTHEETESNDHESNQEDK